MGARPVPAPPVNRTRRDSSTAFGFLDHRHAHRQFTDHLYRNGQRVDDRCRARLRERSVHARGGGLHREERRAAVLPVSQLHRSARRASRARTTRSHRCAESFRRTPFVNAGGRRAGDRPRRHVARLSFAADTEGGVCRDDHPDGSRHRRLDRPGARSAASIARTLVLFISDNGPHQEGGGEPAFFKSSGGLRGIKRDLYEGGIRVPMIARWPETIPGGRVSAHPWAHWDIFPTLAELAGAERAVRSRRHLDDPRASRRAAADA